jgi:DNA modification methylase
MKKNTKKMNRVEVSNSPSGILDRVHLGDARLVSKSLPNNSINTTITSPPYFDLKDYGMPNQIGFGQKYDEYLLDLSKVFTEVFRATKEDGSLWIIIDTFRKDQEVLTLPFDLAAKLKPIGWILRDIIIWKKERTLPWTHEGSTRKIFEYILVLSKGSNKFRYDPDKHREITDLKKWWVRYPERYNPKGKSLEEIWCFDIPTQGSWGDRYIRHFCPLPAELVSRIIQLTTLPEDIVFDPFAGSGTVPTVSHLLNRSYIGIELNPDYIRMFENHLKVEKQKHNDKPRINELLDRESFEQTIINLRILKFGRLILRNLKKQYPKEEIQVFVYRSPEDPKSSPKFKYYSAEYIVSVSKELSNTEVIESIDIMCSKPPLSKFGIQPEISVVSSATQIPIKKRHATYHWYTQSNSHKSIGSGSFKETYSSTIQLSSPINMEVEEPNE